MLSSHIFKILAEILSCPFALFMFNFLIWPTISFSVKFTLFNLKSVVISKGGSTLDVATKVHWFLKYSLKMLHFSLKFVTNEPLCNIGGMMVAVLLLISFFKALQYFFCPVRGLETSSPSFFKYFSFSTKTSWEYSSFRLSK